MDTVQLKALVLTSLHCRLAQFALQSPEKSKVSVLDSKSFLQGILSLKSKISRSTR